jgi:steroid delta-isomerase-like uncharacterized protein
MPTKTKAKTKTRGTEEVARGCFDALNARDWQLFDELYAEEAIEDMVPIGIFRGRAEIHDFFRGLFAASPDYTFVVDRVVTEDRFAAVQWRASGTFSGEAFQGIEATGRHIEARGMDMMEIEDGRLVRNTVYYDGAAFARQVGMLPDQESGAEKAMIAAFNTVTKVRNAVEKRRATA